MLFYLCLFDVLACLLVYIFSQRFCWINHWSKRLDVKGFTIRFNIVGIGISKIIFNTDWYCGMSNIHQVKRWEFGRIMYTYSVCEQYAFYDVRPFVRVLLENFDQRVFDCPILALTQTITLWVISRGNTLFSPCHFMKAFGNFIHKLFTLVVYLNLDTDMTTYYVINELGNCRFTFIFHWFCFRPFWKVVYANN